MQGMTPFLFFGGECRDAMAFYQTCFGGELQISTYDDMPADARADAEQKGCVPVDGNTGTVMHALLSNGNFALMASDNPASTPVKGDNVAISVNCESRAEVTRLFQALSAGGQVFMPPGETFWGAYFAMTADKYGFQWMLSYPDEE